MSVLDFQKSILRWFDQHGRKNLPWQQNKTPYRVWLSEIMLQQTQVTTVIPYFMRFIAAFPDIVSLANAKEDEVLHHWTGLGYYTRARNLHRTAKIILVNFEGKFPNKIDELQNLPGIGRSTAGAILSLAFEKKSAILDGNVKRVLTRFHGITEWPGEKKIVDSLWRIAEKYTPQKRVADYTQAMMDLGATLCIRGTPHCEQCPLQKNCRSKKLGIEKSLPQKRPAKKLPIRKKIFLILKKDHCILLEKNPPTGIWGGLWCFPILPEETSTQEIKKFCRERFQIEIKKITFDNVFRHTFSHFHLDIIPALISIEKNTSRVMEKDKQTWYNLKTLPNKGLPAPVKKLLWSIVP